MKLKIAHSIPPTALPEEQLKSFASALKEIGDAARSAIGKEDEHYIRRQLKTVRYLGVSGRILLFASIFPPCWLLGVLCLASARIIENTEIAHNVMHGQYDWLNDPALNGQRYEIDSVATSDGWRRSHNGAHHGYTGIKGLDEDIGVLRLSTDTPWKVRHIFQPALAAIAALFAQWAVAVQGYNFRALTEKSIKPAQFLRENEWPIRKALGKTFKDYIFFPLLAGPFFFLVFAGNLAANGIRNIWVWLVIICGHCTDNVDRYEQSVLTEQPPEHWYLRQVRGAANLSGSSLFHLFSGHLGYHIEHHLYPDIPSHRYPALSKQVKAVCKQYNVPYNSAPFTTQARRVLRRILLYSFPPFNIENSSHVA